MKSLLLSLAFAATTSGIVLAQVTLPAGQSVTIGGVTVTCSGASSSGSTDNACILTHQGNGSSCSGVYIVTSQGAVLGNCNDLDSSLQQFRKFADSGVCSPSSCQLSNSSGSTSCSGLYVLNNKGEAMTDCMDSDGAAATFAKLRSAGVCF